MSTNLKKPNLKQEVLLRLLPVVKASSKALLSSCSLSDEGCSALSSALSSPSSRLKDLDLRIQDSALKELCDGLENWKLETLRLSVCGFLQDSELKKLCDGLKSPNYKLETLRSGFIKFIYNVKGMEYLFLQKEGR
ncbi:NACHT, LRR and PYD domains-containing protein 9A-like [Melanotaenia boesemani]|uniref:NACHT, LRR and PYD domains-containing protein 9A-like n=1 Tax=Melanotaenia boesemani TaxID=1250792 RepID=UPI001C05BC4A|nr:NACHT, LRR and PYD domains-containing protein 9A-like [Melanotaenia boesemani]